MGGHIIWTFIHVPVQRVTIGHQSCKKSIQVNAHIRVCIFLNEQGCRGVMDKHIADACLDLECAYCIAHCGRNRVEAAARRLNL
jgi:hypothetical protein